MERSIGIDLGGSRIKGALVNRQGSVLKKCTMLTHAKTGPDTVVDQIAGIVNELMDGFDDIAGLGIGAPGPLDARTGQIYTMPNLPEWENYPLREKLQSRLKMDVEIMNDADCAAWGEYLFGVAKEVDNFALLTLGTGIGSSIFIHGRPWVGVSGISPEIGHIPISNDAVQCSCGQYGHVESFVSAWKMIQRIRAAICTGAETILPVEKFRSGNGEVKDIAEAAAKGDLLAVKELTRYAMFLGRTIGLIANLLNLQLIVLTGGIVNSWKLIETTVWRAINLSSFHIQRSAMKIKIGLNPENAGVIGAAAMFLNCRH